MNPRFVAFLAIRLLALFLLGVGYLLVLVAKLFQLVLNPFVIGTQLQGFTEIVTCTVVVLRRCYQAQ